jgi:hypothetical protein
MNSARNTPLRSEKNWKEQEEEWANEKDKE